MNTTELTREAVSVMPAGRDLDALVAERVMGAPARDVPIVGYGPTPPYSTEIGYAWQVVEKMRDTDCDVAVHSCGSAWCLAHGVIGWGPLAPTAPLAICRGALLTTL